MKDVELPCFDCQMMKCSCFSINTKRIQSIHPIVSAIESEISLCTLSQLPCFKPKLSSTFKESTPLPFSKSISTKKVDPKNEYRLSEFSSFSYQPNDCLITEARKKREKKDYMQLTERNQFEAVYVSHLDIAKVTIPQSRRAGQQGVAIDIKECGEGYIDPYKTTTLHSRVKFEQEEWLSDGKNFSPTFSTDSTPTVSPATFFSSFEEKPNRIELNLIESDPRISGFHFSHRSQTHSSTSYIDKSRRSFATRIQCSDSAALSRDLSREVKAATTGSDPIHSLKTDGTRGSHQIRQVGVHREMGAKVGYSLEFRVQMKKWTTLMRGKGFEKARGFASRALKTHYPLVYKYHKSLASSVSKLDLHFLFGAFPSICINSGGKVACAPHRDQANLGPGLCGVMPFGNFDSSRSGWVVLWEAKLCVEVAAGDIFLFPSAIFTHSNTSIHKDDERNSLAFWAGASLFLWQKCGMKCLNELNSEEQEVLFSNVKEDWKKAWDRFPIL